MHISISKLTTIGSDKGLVPVRRQAIIWNNAEILIIGPPRNNLQWNYNRNPYILIQENPFQNAVWKMAAILSQPQCVKRNALGIIAIYLSSRLMENYRTTLKCISSPLEKIGHQSTDDTFRCIFMNEQFCILIKISMKFILMFQLTIKQHWFKKWLGAK